MATSSPSTSTVCLCELCKYANKQSENGQSRKKDEKAREKSATIKSKRIKGERYFKWTARERRKWKFMKYLLFHGERRKGGGKAYNSTTNSTLEKRDATTRSCAA